MDHQDDVRSQHAKPDRPAHEVIAALMDGYIHTQLLYVAAQLRLPDLLGAGPLSVEDLSSAAGADSGVLRRILRGLAMYGIVDERDGTYRLTAAGQLLQSGHPESLRGAVLSRGGLYYGAAGRLLESAQRGGAPFRHAYDAGFFEYLAASPERMTAFQQSMVARAEPEAAELLRVYDFSGRQHIVDVGGGFGVTLAAILRAYPSLLGTLFDRPEVIDAARERLEAAGVAARCRLVGGDAFESIPTDGDLYLLCRVIHDWNDDDAVRMLRSCRTAMHDDARLLLLEAVIADRPSEQPHAILMDIHMLVLGLGQERTRSEFSGLLDRAGFALQRVVNPQGRMAVSVLEARCA